MPVVAFSSASSGDLGLQLLDWLFPGLLLVVLFTLRSEKPVTPTQTRAITPPQVRGMGEVSNPGIHRPDRDALTTGLWDVPSKGITNKGLP